MDPPTLTATVAQCLGVAPDSLHWQQLGSADGSNRVWRVTGGGSSRAVVVKQFRSHRAHAQELRAYHDWLVHLPGHAPPLLATCPDSPPALIFAWVAGHPASDEHEPKIQADLHHQAGQFLRQLHGLPASDRDPVPLGRAIAQRMHTWLDRCGPALVPSTRAQLAQRADHAVLTELFADAARVPCHRDFTPNNWLVGPASITVLDFEHARLDCPWVDLAKLWTGPWHDRPDLSAAFFAGYGHTLTPIEVCQLRIVAALHGLATLGWGKTHNDPTFAALGHQILGRVLA